MYAMHMYREEDKYWKPRTAGWIVDVDFISEIIRARAHVLLNNNTYFYSASSPH